MSVRPSPNIAQTEGALAPIASSPRHCSNQDQRYMNNPGTAISVSFLGSDTTIEMKRRATGFAQLYDWLNDRDVLIGKADRREQVARTATDGVMLSPGSATLVYRRQDKMAPAHHARGGGP